MAVSKSTNTYNRQNWEDSVSFQRYLRICVTVYSYKAKFNMVISLSIIKWNE